QDRLSANLSFAHDLVLLAAEVHRPEESRGQVRVPSWQPETRDHGVAYSVKQPTYGFHVPSRCYFRPPRGYKSRRSHPSYHANTEEVCAVPQSRRGIFEALSGCDLHSCSRKPAEKATQHQAGACRMGQENTPRLGG